MSAHRPTATISLDIFTDRFGDVAGEDVEITDQMIAAAAWQDVQDWVSTGYLPVVTVAMEDGTVHDVDLQEVRR